MSDNPWNVQRNRRSQRHQKPGNQEKYTVSQQVHSPAPKSMAESFAVGAERTAQSQTIKRLPAKAEQGQQNTATSINPLPIILAAIFVLLVFFLTRAIVHQVDARRQYQELVSLREEEERRRQAHKDEHLFARESSGYMDLIKKHSAAFGVSPSFVSAIIKCESSFNPSAVSRVNARGLMQIMPKTGPWLAERLKMEGYQPEMLFDPDTNIRLGVSFLAYLSDVFSGNPVMVAAAYHAGDNSVKRWALNYAEDQRTITLEQIPTDDTRSYVRKVMDAYAIYYEEDWKAL